MFNPDLNPYVAQIQDHKDIIITAPTMAHPDNIQFSDSGLPIVLDIGCGSGNFLRDYALKEMNLNFVGVELRYKRLVKGAKKFKKHKIQNVRLLQAKAEDIEMLFHPGSIKEININFPDPWPKRRQQKHRLVTPEFIEVLNNLLQKEGHFVLKTDHPEYFKTTTNLINNCQFFDIIEYSEDLHNSMYGEDNIPTEFELLFRNKGISVSYIRTAKRQP